MTTGTQAGVPTIPARALHDRHKAGESVELIDVRTPAEFQEVHASIARLEPLDRLDPKRVMENRGERAGEPLYVICRSGSRATKACEMFQAAGYPQVVCVEGGTQAWEQAGLPVVRGKKSMSLERQVRIAAGALVFLGTLAGAFVNPWLLIIPGFVGAGLVFSGITDTCGMGMLIARMPWNQVCDSGGEACSR